MTPIEKLILENQRMLLWENWRIYELKWAGQGAGCRFSESVEIEEQVKKINKFLEKKETKDKPCCNMDAKESNGGEK